MLVAGVGLLLKDSITDQDLKDANHYLSSFCQQVSSLYGMSFINFTNSTSVILELGNFPKRGGV